MSNNPLITTIKTHHTYVLRSLLLRPGQETHNCMFDGDSEKTTVHLGCFFHNNLIGIATLLKRDNERIGLSFQYQLIGMAITDCHRRQGIGTKLLVKAESILLEKGVRSLWCNASVESEPFYTKNGFKITGSEFLIKDLGLHILMHKGP